VSTGSTGIPRPIELLIALAALVLLSPILVLTALAVALTSRGPVVFRHQRIGRHGRVFHILKFRTMWYGASGPALTCSGDRRVTAVGQWLRRTKLDELPTLWNVVRGDMSLVGPRPEAVEYVALDSPMWRDVLSARPGITDPMTLLLRNEEALLAAAERQETFYREYLLPYKLRGYAQYLEERTWQRDLVVLWRTVVAVVSPRRAPAPSPTDVISGVAHRQTES
jgi:lipopolysaccharide/colanic/teichoic acid biosynthesis glycosyltransferase